MNKKNKFLNVDYFCMMLAYYKKFGRCFAPQDYDKLFEKAVANGFTHINWRSRIAGLNCYHSKVSPPVPGGYEIPLQNSLKEALSDHDPLAEARRLSKKHGLKLFAWGDFFDCWLLALDDPNMVANLHWHMLRHDGQWALPGIPCYNEPELRNYILSIYNEQLEYGLDGLFINTSNTHSTMCSMYFRDNLKLQFGYNQPVKEEYKKRTGAELIYPAQQPEVHADILADGLDEMIKQTGKLCHEKNAEFIIMTSREDTLLPPAKDVIHIANHDRQWATWTDTLDQLAIEIHPFAPEQVGNTPHDLESGNVPLTAWITVWKNETEELLQEAFKKIQSHESYESLVIHEAIALEYPKDPHAFKGVETTDEAWNIVKKFN